MQWKMLPIENTPEGQPEIHYTSVNGWFARWAGDESISRFFEASVKHLHDVGELDVSVLNGDGTNTVAKKGGDGIGVSGHKHQKGDKVVPIAKLLSWAEQRRLWGNVAPARRMVDSAR